MLRNFRRTGVAAALLALAAAAAPAAAQNLTGAGATFPYPDLLEVVRHLPRRRPACTINYQSIGSGAGIQQVKAGTVDFGASDAALSNDRLKELPRPVFHFPTVAGAVVLAYNLPGLQGPLQLTPEVLDRHLHGQDHDLERQASRGGEPGRGAAGGADPGRCIAPTAAAPPTSSRPTCRR